MSKKCPMEITIDGQRYVRADAMQVDGDYVIVRSRDSGVHAGYLVSRNGGEVELRDARRIWYWDGAASLSELAVRGTAKPENCKFPASVPQITILGVCEIIPATTAARKSIQGVTEWREG